MRLTILGEPASKANARRLVTIRGRPAFIKSAKAIAYAKAAQWQLEAAKIQAIHLGPVSVSMRIFYASQRPDLDASVVLDVLQGYAYENDRQVRELHLYHAIDKANPRAEIAVEAL
jgi:Holliday junction resolvase RusA-like endonuclease